MTLPRLNTSAAAPPGPSGGTKPSVPTNECEVSMAETRPMSASLGNTMHEDQVRRLDVAVDESMRVQMRQRAREGKADSEALVGREPLLAGAQFFERLGHVTFGKNFIASLNIVGEL